MATTKKPVIGPVTRAKVTGVVRKLQNSKAAGAVKKAGAAIKQEARVVGRAVTGYGLKKEKAKESSSPASAFQIKSEMFGNGPIKSPSQIREQKKKDRSESRVANRMSRSADRSKRGADRSFTTSYPSSGSSERFQSTKEGLTYKGIALPARKRKAVRVISENLNTKLEGRQRKKLAKEFYKDIKSKPKTDAQMRKQNAKKCKGKQAATTGGGNNLCSPQGNNNAGGF